MRDLIISIVLFVVMITAIAGSSLFIIKQTDELCEAVGRIPSIDSPDCEKRIGELRIYWKDFKKIARMSLCYSEINRMECLIEELECHRQTGNNNDFEHVKVTMVSVLKEMARHEKVTLNGVL